MYAERRKSAKAILDELGATYSEKQSGLFVWAKAPAHIADVEKWIDEVLYGTRVFITPGFIFGDAGRRYIRISLCCTVDMLNEALRRIKKFNAEKAANKATSAVSM
jgi:aspartate/methionine/tyrosine aminotransferase